MPFTSAPRPISIWQPEVAQQGKIQFVRPPVHPLGDHYADQISFFAEKQPKDIRICFFGESVAAGYLYAPCLTPAKVLTHHLNISSTAKQTYEVIDLARTNERLETMVATAEAALQLNPDYFVVFAGNNWNLLETPHLSPYFPSVSGRQTFAATLKEKGMFGPALLAAQTRASAIDAAYKRLADLAKAADIPLVAILPEVNLADWETRQPAPWMGNGKSERWYAHYAEAVAQIEKQAWDSLLITADAMLTLDEECCPTSWQLLALAHRGIGNEEEARAAAELAISTAHYATLGFLSAPQISRFDQEVLRKTSHRYGFRLIDLPQILTELTGNQLPGRELFADYCHLNPDGMHMVMGIVTAAILNQSIDTLLSKLTKAKIAPEALAVGHFGAAIHTAHRQLPVNPQNEMVQYWCQQALQASPDIVHTIADLVRARCAHLPSVLTTEQQHNQRSLFPLHQQHGWRYAHFDAPLIQAILDVLEVENNELKDSLLAEIIALRGVGNDPIDLLADGFYLWEPLARFHPELLAYADIQATAIFGAAWPTTSLVVVSDGKSPVCVELVGRLTQSQLDGKSQHGTVRFVLNGYPVTAIQWTNRWQKDQIIIEASSLQYGINKLEICWPHSSAEAGLKSAITKLEKGDSADLYPIYGELFSVIVFLCERVES